MDIIFGPPTQHLCTTHGYGGPLPCKQCELWPVETRGRQPFRCPICDGRGEVGVDFYISASTDNATMRCRTCNGKGVIWSEQ